MKKMMSGKKKQRVEANIRGIKMSRNDITGDKLRSKPNTKAFRDNYDSIFGNKKCSVKSAKSTSDLNLKEKK